MRLTLNLSKLSPNEENWRDYSQNRQIGGYDMTDGQLRAQQKLLAPGCKDYKLAAESMARRFLDCIGG